jgi:hypothetical protein
MTNINIEAVINDLAEQVKKLTVDNAVLRAALATAQQQQHDHAVPQETFAPDTGEL